MRSKFPSRPYERPARTPEPPPPARRSAPENPLPACRPRAHPIAGLAAPLFLALLLSSCVGTAIYQPVDFEVIHGRSAVFLAPVHLPPIDKALHGRIVRKAEAELEAFPHFGGFLTHREARERALEDPELQRALDLSTETLTVVGISERGTTSRLGSGLDVEMLVTVQLIFTPCETCPDGSQLALIANLVEASSARLLWRGHFVENMDESDDDTIEEEALLLLEEFFVRFDEDLRPKWQRLRFFNLGGKKAV